MRRWFPAFALMVVASACGFDGAQGAAIQGEPAAALPDAASGPGIDAAPAAPDASPADAGVAHGQLVSSPTATPPILDGKLEALWDAAEVVDFEMANAAQFYNLHPSYDFDAQVAFSSLYDDDNLYLSIRITDGTLHSDPGTPLYQNDAIELYFDGHNDGGEYGADDNWLVVGVTGSYASLGPADADLGGAIVATDSGYAIEIHIPREDLHIADGSLGFNLAVVDDDDLGDPDADAYGLWYSPGPSGCDDCCEGEDEPQAWCDANLLGELILAP